MTPQRLRMLPIAVAVVLAMPLACTDAPTGPINPEAVGTAGMSGSANVIQVDPPGGVDFVTLQSAIDDNPGAVLQLQPGTYDIGAERLTIPHGLTLRGATDAAGELLTTIEGADPVTVVHVRALGEHADEEITLVNLGIHAPVGTGVLHRAFDFDSGEFVFPGGGDLTVVGCDIRTEQAPTPGPDGGALWVNVVDDVAIRIESSTFTATADGAIILDGAVYSSLEIRDNTIISEGAGILFNGQGFLFRDEQDPSAAGIARIVDNEIEAGTGSNFIAAGLNILTPRGVTFASGNTVRMPGSERTDVLRVGMQVDNPLGEQVQVTGNELIGGSADDGKLRFGLLVSGDRGHYRDNSFQDFWSTGVVVALPILPFLTESSHNNFLHNDFSEARIAPDTEFGFPAVHWWLAPESSQTSVTDNSGVEQLILDQGTGNHFQGSSFLPMPAGG